MVKEWRGKKFCMWKVNMHCYAWLWKEKNIGKSLENKRCYRSIGNEKKTCPTENKKRCKRERERWATNRSTKPLSFNTNPTGKSLLFTDYTGRINRKQKEQPFNHMINTRNRSKHKTWKKETSWCCIENTNKTICCNMLMVKNLVAKRAFTA